MQIEFVSVQSLPRISRWFSSAKSMKMQWNQSAGTREQAAQCSLRSKTQAVGCCPCQADLSSTAATSSSTAPIRAAQGLRSPHWALPCPSLSVSSLPQWQIVSLAPDGLNAAMNERGYLLMDGWNGKPKLSFAMSFLPMWTGCPPFSFCLEWLPPWTFNNSESSLPGDQKMCIKRFRETARACRISLSLFDLHCSGY